MSQPDKVSSRPLNTVADGITSIRREGPTPNGGAYSIAFFLDAQRRPVPRESAVLVEISEYDEQGRGIYRTWGYMHGKPSEDDSAAGR